MIENVTLDTTEQLIKDKITELFVIFNILKPTSNDERNADTFIRSLLRIALPEFWEI